jgi:hypothetical protein
MFTLLDPISLVSNAAFAQAQLRPGLSSAQCHRYQKDCSEAEQRVSVNDDSKLRREVVYR